MLTISAHTVQVFDAVEIRYQFANPAVGIKIGGICFGYPLNVRIHHRAGIGDQTKLKHFTDCHLPEIIVGQIPEGIALVGKILQSQPHRVLQILYKVRRPVVVNLEPPHFYLPVLYINPAVRNNIAHGFQFCPVFQGNFGNKYAHGDVIPVGKSLGNLRHIGRHIVDTLHQILQRHGGNHIIPI